MTWRLNNKNEDFAEKFYDFLHEKRNIDQEVDEKVHEIIHHVEKKGDQALLEYTNMFDQCQYTNIDQISIKKQDIEKAYERCETSFRKAIHHIIQRIKNFHEKTKPEDFVYFDEQGNRLGMIYHAVERAALYVPGGKATYPSSLIMNAVPAMVAGVNEIVIINPTPRHERNDVVLATAHALGINTIYTIGGAQAIAAVAHGTQTIKKVDVITGPGNAYVASAKKQLYGQVGIDMIAGPSEILVIADKNNDPKHVAIDLLSQAEHDEQAQSILVSDDPNFAQKVEENITDILLTLPRKEIAKKSWDQYGAVILVGDIHKDSPEIANKIAPEHCQIMVEEPYELHKKIKHAGAVFIGKYTPEAIGDYIAGPNHVLPTNKTARFSSSLGVEHFMKRSSLIECSQKGFEAIKEDAIILAQCEGLDAHALSMKWR